MGHFDDAVQRRLDDPAGHALVNAGLLGDLERHLVLGQPLAPAGERVNLPRHAERGGPRGERNAC